MKYKYIPNTINTNELEKRGLDYLTFLKLQLKYRESLENIIKQYIDIKTLDKEIERLTFKIPLINDLDYNFYHKFSYLGSKYIFIRNNIHIERLNATELKQVIDAYNTKTILSEEFIKNTLETVLFEDGDKVCFGTPLPTNMADAKSITIEFAYDEYKCKILEGPLIKNKFDKAFEEITKALEPHFKVKISKLIFNGFDKIYKN